MLSFSLLGFWLISRKIVFAITLELVLNSEVLSTTTTAAATRSAFFTIAATVSAASATSAAATTTSTLIKDNAVINLILLLALILRLLLVILTKLLDLFLQLNLAILSVPSLLLLNFGNLAIQVVQVDGGRNLNAAKILDDNNVDVKLKDVLFSRLRLLALLLAFTTTNAHHVLLFSLLLGKSSLEFALLDFLVEVLLGSLREEV